MKVTVLFVGEEAPPEVVTPVIVEEAAEVDYPDIEDCDEEDEVCDEDDDDVLDHDDIAYDLADAINDLDTLVSPTLGSSGIILSESGSDALYVLYGVKLAIKAILKLGIDINKIPEADTFANSVIDSMDSNFLDLPSGPLLDSINSL